MPIVAISREVIVPFWNFRRERMDVGRFMVYKRADNISFFGTNVKVAGEAIREAIGEKTGA